MFGFSFPQKWRFLATIAIITIVLMGNFAQAVHASNDPCIGNIAAMDACIQAEVSKENTKKDGLSSNVDAALSCHICGHLTGSSIEKIAITPLATALKIDHILIGSIIEDLFPKGLFRPPRTA